MARDNRSMNIMLKMTIFSGCMYTPFEVHKPAPDCRVAPGYLGMDSPIPHVSAVRHRWIHPCGTAFRKLDMRCLLSFIHHNRPKAAETLCVVTILGVTDVTAFLKNWPSCPATKTHNFVEIFVIEYEKFRCKLKNENSGDKVFVSDLLPRKFIGKQSLGDLVMNQPNRQMRFVAISMFLKHAALKEKFSVSDLLDEFYLIRNSGSCGIDTWPRLLHALSLGCALSAAPIQTPWRDESGVKNRLLMRTRKNWSCSIIKLKVWPETSSCLWATLVTANLNWLLHWRKPMWKKTMFYSLLLVFLPVILRDRLTSKEAVALPFSLTTVLLINGCMWRARKRLCLASWDGSSCCIPHAW